ncbi:hypothetical protein CSC80_03585 [Maribacter sp. 6B07]|uniref:restriction endonuclease subunit S n=1 Tax=Maribacter sp. 6B07 TaxID=2045442 RepID=UPI000C079DD6|nr:restriction endonuclease subunit S [Maribacter sp. 6B07]PHN94448.1 hypothetical protein CSC80_03585 [Maribacter sp. 6B07]
MAKKYFDNHKLQIAYDYYFSNIVCNTWENIHSVLDITSGDNLPKRKMIKGKYQVYGGGGITNNSHNEFNIDYETIGIGRVGARCGCVFNIKKNSWVTDNALLVQSFDDRLSLNFLKHYLNYQNLGQFANNAMQPVISKTRISSIKLPIIDLVEQNKIANNLDILENNTQDYKDLDNDLLSKISVVDKWKELTFEVQTQKQLLDDLKQAFLQEAIQGKLTQEWRKQNQNTEPVSELLERIKGEKEQLIKDKKIRKEKPFPPITEEEIPFEIPENWVWCRIPQVLALTKNPLRRGPFGSSLKKNMFEPKSSSVTKVYEQQNAIKKNYSLGNYYISTEKYPNLKSFLAGPGDIIVSCAGTIGETYKLPSDAPIGIINQALLKIKLNNSAILDSFFLIMFKSQLKSKVNSDARGSAMKNMGSVKYLQNELVFGLPPFEEQKAIVEKVETLMQKCNALEQEITQSEQHANMLMQAVLKEAFESKTENKDEFDNHYIIKSV